LKRFEVESFLKEGSYGRVYLGNDINTNEKVVIKELKIRKNSNPQEAADDIEIFRDEAKFLEKITLKNVVRILSYGGEKGRFFIILEYLDGGDLIDLKSRKKITQKEAIGIALEVLSGLEAIHSAGVVVRDIKPNNVLFSTKDKCWKIIDLGISKSSAIGTRRGAKGRYTPFFSSSEQVRGQQTDERSDLYSVGAIFVYLLCTGAFKADRYSNLLRTVHGPSPSPQEIENLCPKMSRQLSIIVSKTLSVEPVKRYSSAPELRNEILQLGAQKQYSLFVIKMSRAQLSSFLHNVKNRLKRLRIKDFFAHTLIPKLKSIKYKTAVPALGALIIVYLAGQLLIKNYIDDTRNTIETESELDRTNSRYFSAVSVLQNEIVHKGLITGFKVNLRKEPDLQSVIKYNVNLPMALYVLDAVDGWYMVRHNEEICFVWSGYVRPISAASGIWCKIGRLEIGVWMCDEYGNIIKWVNKEAKVVIIKTISNAVEIGLPDGLKGFVPRSAVVYLNY